MSFLLKMLSDNTVFYTEANADNDNKLSADDGILKKTRSKLLYKTQRLSELYMPSIIPSRK